MPKVSKSAIDALAIKSKADELGWTITVRGAILTITKSFTPGSNDEFCAADSEYFSILSLLKRSSPGSDWGTDGGGIGALTAIETGLFTMNRSGGNKNTLRALARIV